MSVRTRRMISLQSVHEGEGAPGGRRRLLGQSTMTRSPLRSTSSSLVGPDQSLVRWITQRPFTSRPNLEEDPYDVYRSPTDTLSPAILAELQLETIHTREQVNPKRIARIHDQIYNTWLTSQQQRPPPQLEYGPTGTWRYGFIEPPGGEEEREDYSMKRIYQRMWQDSQGYQIQQTVLELDPTDAVLSLSLTPDESCIACLVEDATTNRRQLRIRHIETDRQISIDDVGGIVTIEWGASTIFNGGSHSLYLVGTDSQGRPDRVLVTKVHSTVLQFDEPELLIQSHDLSEIVDVQRTKGCEYVAIRIMTKTSNEIYLSSGYDDSLQLVMQRQPNFQYHLDVGEKGDIVMLLSDDGHDYELYETSITSLPLDPDGTLRNIRNVSRGKETVITDMDLFRDYLVLYETSTTTGYPQITVRNRDSDSASHSTTIPLDPKMVQVNPAGNLFFGATSLRLLVENPCMPPKTLELDFSSLELKPMNGIDEERSFVAQERVFVSSSDGIQVPMSLFYSHKCNDATVNGGKQEENPPSWWSVVGATTPSNIEISNEDQEQESRPVLLVGYGSYGESVNFGFDPTLISLLSHGYVIAFAHTRGGGELGRTWYHTGRLHSKPNAISDFLSCAEYLQKRFHSKVSVRGFSAAGIVLGAAVNRRPTLFKSLVLTNPFLDLFATMNSHGLYLTPHEWDEFGNPQDDEDIHHLIQSYCPVRNVPPCTDSYPRCLLIGTLDDENVPWWNPVIFAKKIREGSTTSDKKDNVLLHVGPRGGHHLGPKRLEVAALEVSFLLQGENH